MTRIMLFNETLTFSKRFYGWAGSTDLVKMLNDDLDPQGHGPSGADPNPARTAAELAKERFGARILETDPTEKIPEGSVA